MPIQQVTDYAWLHSALVFGLEMSKDPSRKIGACIVHINGRSVSFGYNGLVAGIPETEENWARPRKYKLVRHAELNAILNAPFDVRGGTLYSTLKPCHDCLGDAVNAGISRFVWLENDIEFIENDIDVWNEISSMIKEMKEYRQTDITKAIKYIYGDRHDNYKDYIKEN